MPCRSMLKMERPKCSTFPKTCASVLNIVRNYSNSQKMEGTEFIGANLFQ